MSKIVITLLILVLVGYVLSCDEDKECTFKGVKRRCINHKCENKKRIEAKKVEKEEEDNEEDEDEDEDEEDEDKEADKKKGSKGKNKGKEGDCDKNINCLSEKGSKFLRCKDKKCIDSKRKLCKTKKDCEDIGKQFNCINNQCVREKRSEKSKPCKKDDCKKGTMCKWTPRCVRDKAYKYNCKDKANKEDQNVDCLNSDGLPVFYQASKGHECCVMDKIFKGKNGKLNSTCGLANIIREHNNSFIFCYKEKTQKKKESARGNFYEQPKYGPSQCAPSADTVPCDSLKDCKEKNKIFSSLDNAFKYMKCTSNFCTIK